MGSLCERKRRPGRSPPRSPFKLFCSSSAFRCSSPRLARPPWTLSNWASAYRRVFLGPQDPPHDMKLHESSSAHGPFHLISVSFSPNPQSSMNSPSSSPTPPSLAPPHSDDYSEQSPLDGPSPSYLEFASRPPKRFPSRCASSSFWILTAPSSSAPCVLPSPTAADAISTPRPAASCPVRISPPSARISSRRGRALGSMSWSGARRSPTALRI